MEKKQYAAIHKWLKDNYGKAHKCEFCKTTEAKRYDWALKQDFEYKKDRDSFIQLCRSCHIKYDFTDKRREKISKSQKGDKNNFFGKQFTEEMKEKQRAKKVSKSVEAVNLEMGKVLRVNSIAEAWKTLGLKKSNIIAYLKGRYNGKTYKGWQFTYC